MALFVTSPTFYKGERRPEAIPAILISEKHPPQTTWIVTPLPGPQILSVVYV